MKILMLGVLPLMLAGTWGALMLPSMSGYGYAGHNGWNHGPSFFYFNSTSTVAGRSVRGSGRVGGTGGGK